MKTIVQGIAILAVSALASYGINYLAVWWTVQVIAKELRGGCGY